MILTKKESLIYSEAKAQEEVFFKNLDCTDTSITLLRTEEHGSEKTELAPYLTVKSMQKKK